LSPQVLRLGDRQHGRLRHSQGHHLCAGSAVHRSPVSPRRRDGAAAAVVIGSLDVLASVGKVFVSVLTDNLVPLGVGAPSAAREDMVSS